MIQCVISINAMIWINLISNHLLMASIAVERGAGTECTVYSLATNISHSGPSVFPSPSTSILPLKFYHNNY
uniref:Secreted protein n=1 Tax=Strigamia maritima TaxID=126957 RepID=T1IL01_STRMM